MAGEELAAALIWCPFPDEEAALDAAKALVDGQLAACGNVLPGLTSVFVWKANVETAREVGLLLKTNSVLLESAIEKLGQLHPYEEPAIVGWHCDAAFPATLEWLAALAPRA